MNEDNRQLEEVKDRLAEIRSLLNGNEE